MDFNEYISDNFKKRYMGILLDNSQGINSVYTAVLPSNNVLNKILELSKEDVLLVTHHPMIWDIRNTPVFQDINPALLPTLKQQKISIYTIHVPLDKNGENNSIVPFGVKFEGSVAESLARILRAICRLIEAVVDLAVCWLYKKKKK